VDPQESAVTAETLKVRYRNGAIGVDSVSLEVRPGQVVAVFGPNGAGKTTTMRAISGFMRSEGARVIQGRVGLFGADVPQREPHRTTRRGVAFVPERRKVFASLTVNENLAASGKLPPRARRTEIYDRIYELFPVLKSRPRELAGRLSGGQQQMLAIGRSLLCEPRLLIVDELTLGLHRSLHLPLFKAMRTIALEGTAVIVVDESTSAALEVVDHCYLLNGGQVTMAGPASQFRGNELLAAGYVESV
jgi:branched-chain amino acid transport system ATP-binding protein